MFAVLILLNVLSCVSGLTVYELVVNDYNRWLRPLHGKETLNVTAQVGLLHIKAVDENSFTFELDFILRFWWNDERLKFPANSSDKIIEMSSSMEGVIWIPSIVIVNAEHTNVQKVMRYVIKKNGDIYWSRRVIAKCSCKMELSRYPMDVQICPLILEDYTFGSLDVNVSWHKTPYVVSDDGKLDDIPGYDLNRIYAEKIVRTFMIGGKPKQYDLLTLHMVVQRMYTYFVYRVYIPSILLMVFNLSSYWIPHHVAPARVGLIVTTFLTNTFILQSVTESTAKVPYTTSLQLFLMGNVVFLLISIIEYLILLSMVEKKDTSTPVKEIYAEDQKTGNMGLTGKVHWLDRLSRCIFPPLYIAFNIVYFLYYLVL